MLLIFEDAQWADSTSLELLDRGIERATRLPVLMLITSRPEFRAPWVGQAHVSSLSLSRLAERETAALVSAVAGGKSLPGDVADRIVHHSDGIPLFIEELTKTLLESGLLREEGDRYSLSGQLPPLAIPSSLQGSLMARLDRLAPVKEVAQIGAALGRQFPYDLLAAVARHSDSQLRRALEQLVDAGLVFRRGSFPHASFILSTPSFRTPRTARYCALSARNCMRVSPGLWNNASPNSATSSPRSWPITIRKPVWRSKRCRIWRGRAAEPWIDPPWWRRAR